ncbi:MAG: aspartate 1-decarboxylase [Heliobacteriaceae bacterium]|nr:aspartate 1-decarboxylase [Heliobacteriaceae bacterium]MDD4587955.1 aspartate 1-decarboxylase [Heliobacteriaceae bacterium]
MLRIMHKSKIHRATVTEANLNYVGSITIDQDLMDAADILENEKVQVVNNNNGARLETYVIPGRRASGVICLNGAAARLVQPGDSVIIIAYAMFDDREAKNHRPRVVFVDEHNRPVARQNREVAGTTGPTFLDNEMATGLE